RGLAALDAEAQAQAGVRFHAMAADAQDSLLRRVQHGQAYSPAWAGMPPELFFRKRVLHDIVGAYYGHPTAWSEIGFGGPASPRGYVRLDFDRRDPWEASEARPGREDEARRENERVR
ncbi:MAG TPA: gluconate 2-dehydrogenase subunit 3 family protein, partial [Burkholderiaceae bacterium]